MVWYRPWSNPATGAWGFGAGTGRAPARRQVTRTTRRSYMPTRGAAKATYYKPKRTYKRRSYRKTYRKKGKMAKLSRTVYKMKKDLETNTGTHTFRTYNVGKLSAGQNASIAVDADINSIDRLEDAIAGLRYYDPGTPGTLLVAPGATGTFHKEFRFTKTYAKLTVRNNYQVPCSVTLYTYKVRVDTNINPFVAFTDGLADVGSPSATGINVHPSDSPILRDLYILVKSKKAFLQPGQAASLVYSVPSFMYNPSLSDEHADTWQVPYGGASFLIRLQGILGHDSVVTTEQATLPAAIDFSIEKTFIIRYPAGADIKTVANASQADASFTNVGVVSNKAVSDNQSLSVI